MQEVSESKQPFVKRNGKHRQTEPVENSGFSRPSSASSKEALLGLELFDSNSNAIMLVDPETDLIRAANPLCHKLFGYEPGELIGTSYYKLLQPEAYAVYQKQKIQVLAGDSPEKRQLGRQKKGQPIFVKVVAKGLSYLGKTELLLTIQQTLLEENGRLKVNLSGDNDLTKLVASAGFSETNQRYELSFEELAPLVKVILSQIKLRLSYSSAATLAIQGGELSLLDCEFDEVQSSENRWLHLALALTQAAEETLLKGLPLVVSDLERQPELVQELAEYIGMFPDLEVETVNGSWLAVPLTLEGQLVGAINLFSSWPDHFLAEDLKMIEDITSRAMLTRTRLYRRIQGRILERERIRLARELHDSVNQNLYGIQLLANTALGLLEQGKTEELAYYLKKISTEAGDGTGALRTLLLDLRPEFLETVGLSGALQRQVDSLTQRKIKVETRFDPEPPLLPEQKQVFYFIGREALHNAVRHARASKIELGFYRQNTNLILEIRDNGQGFEANASFVGHVGLYSMRERAMLIGARFEITSQPGQGTLVRLCLPLASGGI